MPEDESESPASEDIANEPVIETPAVVAEIVHDEAEDTDPLGDLHEAELANLGDAYSMHASILDEQRAHVKALNDLSDSIQSSVSELRTAMGEFTSFVTSEHARIEEKQPPVDTTVKGGSFGGPGF